MQWRVANEALRVDDVVVVDGRCCDVAFGVVVVVVAVAVAAVIETGKAELASCEGGRTRVAVFTVSVLVVATWDTAMTNCEKGTAFVR